MGFTVTSNVKIRGVTKTNYYYTIKYRVNESNRSVDSDGKMQYTVRYTRFIFADKLEYLAWPNNWFNDAQEIVQTVTYEQCVGNVRTAIYDSWKAELTGATIVDDIEPATPVMDLLPSNDLTVPNHNCNYYVIKGSTQINTINTTDFKQDDTLTLQFTENITIKHNHTDGAYGKLFLSGNADFSATDKCVLHLTFNGTDWDETSREVPV